MAQLYLLSVATLLFGGALAASGFLSERMTSLSVLADLSDRRGIVVTVGVLALIVGVLKLFLRAPGDSVAVAGDLLPAIAGIAIGGVLLLAQSRRSTEVSPDLPRSQTEMVVAYRSPIGLAGVVIGLLHFLFPAAVIL